MSPSATHLVLIPAYNPGRLLRETVEAARQHWQPISVVVDGSTDGSHEAVVALAEQDPGLRVLLRPSNGGKGAAVLTGVESAAAAGFTHVLVMDADGQHPAERIADFMAASAAAPTALVCGQPIFGCDVPLIRLYGRKLSVGLVHWETAGPAVRDPLFGFRVYPVDALRRIFHATQGARRYDFDPEMAVRLVWAGVPTINLPAACRYPKRAHGGISHFHYLRDNWGMVRLHCRLLLEKLFSS